MKTLLAIVVAVSVGLAVAWVNRLDLLMWGVPVLADLTDPIAPNAPTAWPEGPSAAELPPGERPPNIVLIFADDYTAHIGKWHLGGQPGMRPEDQGFDDSLYMAGTFYLPEEHPEVVNAMDEDDGIERMVWTMARYAAQWNGGPSFEPDEYLYWPN